MERKADPRAISVLVVEDNRLLLDGIVAILSRQPDLRVVAVAEDAEAALLRVTETLPRVVLVDAGLGNHDSQALVEGIAQAVSGIGVIVMDMLAVPEDVVEFVKRGASGFVVKQASVDDFIETIRAVARGEEVLPPVLTSTLFSHIAHQATTHAAAGASRAVRMTKREREVIALIADGNSNKEIARRLHISTHTVKSHVRNVLEKLALHSRLQVAAYAHEAGASTQEAR
ncbi:MAG: response regulator transcription factor [Longimicrobiales bacterium]|nr:response regulator transcription factor [Longimicrobiales bacterium]